jgi:CRP-like cAMP-binding protein
MEANQYLYKQDESISDFMYIIYEGSVSVLKGIKQQHEIERLEAPCVVGEAALLHSALRKNSVLTLERCKICSIHRSTFKELVKLVSP